MASVLSDRSSKTTPAMTPRFDLQVHGLRVPEVARNAAPALLYHEAIEGHKAVITSTGALATSSGAKTGRSPKDKRIVVGGVTHGDIWWGNVNIPLMDDSFRALRKRAVDYLNTFAKLYVVDGYAGWDAAERLKIRVICASPYHALFMENMLVRPTAEELASFGEPDYVIYNAGGFPADSDLPGMTSGTSVALNLDPGELVILGTQYAGEMKKGIFTIMNYEMPKRGILSMHCAANEGATGDVTLLFGLSGTGKTTLSADPQRRLIGDDEHCWSDRGVFNIEGGCYAKCIHLSAEKEPQIYSAIRFGTVLENTVQDPVTHIVDFSNSSLTENTRASYPIEFIPAAKIPCLGGHPRNILFLTCDAFGVLPPVAKLSVEQALYHFVSGYTAKVAGTEMGVTEPEATFSACYGAAFLAWHPAKYAKLLAEKMQRHGTHAWLVNTGWTGGPYGAGQRMKLSHTRAILDAIHNGTLANQPTETDPIFGFAVPTQCPSCPKDVLLPRKTWSRAADYDAKATKLAKLFQDNFGKYAAGCSAEIAAAGPKVS